MPKSSQIFALDIVRNQYVFALLAYLIQIIIASNNLLGINPEFLTPLLSFQSYLLILSALALCVDTILNREWSFAPNMVIDVTCMVAMLAGTVLMLLLARQSEKLDDENDRSTFLIPALLCLLLAAVTKAMRGIYQRDSVSATVSIASMNAIVALLLNHVFKQDKLIYMQVSLVLFCVNLCAAMRTL